MTQQGLNNSRGETILVVEDNQSLRVMLQYLLSSLGYHVLAVGKPGDAEVLARNLAGPIHLLVLDVHLPAHNGYDVARRLLAVRPTCSVLFISGLTEASLTCDRTVPAANRFLMKPFEPRVLMAKIRDLLDAA